MSVFVSLLLGSILLAGAILCIVLFLTMKRPVFRTLAIILGGLFGLFALYCAAALLLVAGIH